MQPSNDSTVSDIVSKVIAKRTSVRRFTEEAVSDADVEQILRAGINAPSGSNWQNQRFLVVSAPDEIKRIGEIRFVWPYRNSNSKRIREKNPAGILGHGTLLILIFADSYENDRRGNGEYNIWAPLEIQNCSASIQNMLIQATALGLGTCWVSASESMSYTRMLSGHSWKSALSGYDIPEWFKIQGLIVVGHPTKKDDEGYPKGEAKHGATIWQSTERGPTTDYLIEKKHQDTPSRKLGGFQRVKLKIYSFLIGKLRKVLAKLDRAIHRIEIDFIESKKS